MTTSLNQAQIEVLNALSVLKTDEEVFELKKVISEFFARRADAAFDKLWESGEWNDEKLQEMKNAHYRTPYKS